MMNRRGEEKNAASARLARRLFDSVLQLAHAQTVTVNE